MKIHKACIARLFEKHDQVLDAETIADIARELTQVAPNNSECRMRQSNDTGDSVCILHSELHGSSMPRVVGIDPGTVTVDLCGLDDGRAFLDRSIPTSEALATPSRIPDLLEQAAPIDLVVGPSGYGLPLTAARI